MNLYRYLTGPDDASFCHRITGLLNRGWRPYGLPTLTYDVGWQRVVCGQAVTKEIENAQYTPDLDLSRL